MCDFVKALSDQTQSASRRRLRFNYQSEVCVSLSNSAINAQSDVGVELRVISTPSARLAVLPATLLIIFDNNDKTRQRRPVVELLILGGAF